MNNSIKQPKNTSLPLKKIDGGNVRLILTADFLASVTYMHNLYGNNEWSGILLYNRLSGEDITNFVFKAEAVYPLALGSAAYVEGGQERGELDVMQMYDEVPSSMEMRSGFIHTHHSMDTFFSTTDNDELIQNADKYDFYLSLIVNFSGRYTARVAFLGESEERKVSFRSVTGKESFFTLPKDKCIYYTDVDIEFEIPEFVANRFNSLLEDEKKKKAAYAQNVHNYYPQHYGRQGELFEWEKPVIQQPWQSAPKIHSIVVPDNFDKLQIKSFLLKWLSLDFNYEGNFAGFREMLKKNAADDQTFYLDMLEENLDEHLLSLFLVPSIEDIDEKKLSDFCEQACQVLEENLADWEEFGTVYSFLLTYVLEEEPVK